MITMLQLYTPETTTDLKSRNIFEEVLQRVLRLLPCVCYMLVKQVSTEPLHFRFSPRLLFRNLLIWGGGRLLSDQLHHSCTVSVDRPPARSLYLLRDIVNKM